MIISTTMKKSFKKHELIGLSFYELFVIYKKQPKIVGYGLIINNEFRWISNGTWVNYIDNNILKLDYIIRDDFYFNKFKQFKEFKKLDFKNGMNTVLYELFLKYLKNI